MTDAISILDGCAFLMRPSRGTHQSSVLSEISSQFHDECSAVPGRFCIERCGESGSERRNLVFGPAILPLSLAKMAQMTQAFPDRNFSGIGGIAEFAHALNYFLLGCGTVQVCTAAMLDSAVGPNVIKRLTAGMNETMEKRGWKSLDDFRGLLRDRVVAHSKIRRPEGADYRGGYEAEGYTAT